MTNAYGGLSIYVRDQKAEIWFTSHSPHVPLSVKEALDNGLLHLLAVLRIESRVCLDISPHLGLHIDGGLLPAVDIKYSNESILPKLHMDKILHVLSTTIVEVVNHKHSYLRRGSHHVWLAFDKDTLAIR